MTPGWDRLGAFTIIVEWLCCGVGGAGRAFGDSTPYGTIIWVTERERDGPGRSPLPPPLKVYSECPEGKRSDGLLLLAPHEGHGLPG